MFIKKHNTIESLHVYTGNVTFLYKGELLIGRIFGKHYRSPNLIFSEILYNILSDGKIYEGIPHHVIEDRN